MNKYSFDLKKFLIFFILIFFSNNIIVNAEEEKIDAVIDQLQILAQDLKTLEKAVYKTAEVSSSQGSISTNGLNEEILTRHLLKLNEIEEEFRKLTNRFEEVNFKLDNLSSRVTKIQSDTQLRFTDLDSSDKTKKLKKNTKQAKLPGTEKAQDFGSAPAYNLDPKEKTQATQSVEPKASVFSEARISETSLLPNKPPKEQYDFAVSFMKVGDYETAELALREFIDKNKSHELAGSAQYWYGETFRIRQLYSDAATAYLDGYQNYPKSQKAPENLLKLGSTMVELGEKDQGCKMIRGLKKSYPKHHSLCYKRLNMSKKDLSVLKIKKINIKNKDILIYSNFKFYLKKIIKKKTFLVAVSGGPDSLALTALSKTYSKENKNKVFFVLIDHGIRLNSSKEAKAVQFILKKKKIHLTILKNFKKIDKNIQSNARRVRYKLLLDYCKKHKINFILTGHHRDDQIETFLIRLSRGSGIQGLSSMKKKSNLNNKIKLIRPLLDEKKEELGALAKKYFGKIFKDPSNTNKKYLRTRIRDLIKKFEKSGIKHESIINSINNLGTTRDTLDNYILQVKKSCVIKKKENFFINLDYFSLENNEIQLKIFSNCIKDISKNYYPPRAKKALNLLNKIRYNVKFKATLGGCIIQRNSNNLVICKED